MNLTREGSVLSSSARVAMMHAIVGVSSCGVAAYVRTGSVGGWEQVLLQHHHKSRKVGVGAARIKVGVDWKWKSHHN